MIATTKLRMTDLSHQKRFDTDLGDELTPQHTVDQAIELFIEQTGIPSHGLRWTAFSRGVRLDKKSALADLPESDASWTVMPEVSAG